MQTNAHKGGFDCMRTSATQLHTKACHADVCSCMAILIAPTVTALAVLNGPLRSLDVCCLLLLGDSVAWSPCIS